MPANLQFSKLAELRAKTDRQLVSTIDNALAVGLLLAANEADVDAAGVLHRRAAQTCANTAVLVTLIEILQEPRRLEEKFRRLGDALDRQVQIGGRVGVLPKFPTLPRCSALWLSTSSGARQRSQFL